MAVTFNGALKLTSIAPILIKRQIRIIAYQPQALASFLLTKDWSIQTFDKPRILCIRQINITLRYGHW